MKTKITKKEKPKNDPEFAAIHLLDCQCEENPNVILRALLTSSGIVGYYEIPLDLGSFAEGTYFVRLTAGEAIQTSSFQVIR